MKTLRLILGDQLSRTLSSLHDFDVENDTILMCEVMAEATSCQHHKKKMAFLFSAMRHFAEELRQKGFCVFYTKLDDADNTQSFLGEVERFLKDNPVDKIIITEPSEYRVLNDMKAWEEKLSMSVEIRTDDRFLANHDDFSTWAEGRKQLRMEYFYRTMRARYSILMNGDKPEGGQWNYDSDNRQPPNLSEDIPVPFYQKPDAITQEVITLVDKTFPNHFGDIEPFYFAVNRDEALAALDLFIKERLPRFGPYQDAMIEGEAWLFHSHISFYLNCGLLLPLECIKRAEHAYYAGEAPLSCVEGFIRQILGWREFVRGLYWLKMPDYENQNYLEATRPLPDFFWNGRTELNCVRQVILETQKNAYAHHIQRLMVIGNFALLCGFSVEEVNDWYLVVYADAFQWVELPNVSGMVLFADGGLLASKPYAASGAYINKMSTYCKNCGYKVSVKNGPKACPFNYLYWNFFLKHEEKLGKNPRLGMPYRTLLRMSDEKIEAIQDDSTRFFKSLAEG